MKKRQHLPLMAKLNFKVDIDKLKAEFFQMGYDNYEMYNGLDYGNNTEDGLVVRRVLLEYFLTDEEKEARKDKLVADGGYAYKMLCLTEFNGDPESHSKGLADELKESGLTPQQFARRLEKVSDPSHPNYTPIADEKLYDKRNEYCKGYVAEVMDMIEENIGHVTRSRYAVLMPGEEIKPHMDINTDKAIRIHIPLFTDPKVGFGVKGKRSEVFEHMPADGGVWFINQAYTHWVKNESDQPRVHLVFSVVGQNNIEDAEQIWYDSTPQSQVA